MTDDYEDDFLDDSEEDEDYDYDDDHLDCGCCSSCGCDCRCYECDQNMYLCECAEEDDE